MNKKTKHKAILFLPLFLIFLIALNMKAKAGMNIVTGVFDQVYMGVDGGLVFYGNWKVDFKVTSGTWNGTDGTLAVDSDSGVITFDAEDNCVIAIKSYGANRVFQVRSENAVTTKIAGNYSVSITSGPNVIIRWHYLPWSILDSYFMLGVGLTGIVLMIAGPLMFARTIVREGLTDHAVEWIGYMMLFLLLGWGFVVVWLWPT